MNCETQASLVISAYNTPSGHRCDSTDVGACTDSYPVRAATTWLRIAAHLVISHQSCANAQSNMRNVAKSDTILRVSQTLIYLAHRGSFQFVLARRTKKRFRASTVKISNISSFQGLNVFMHGDVHTTYTYRYEDLVVMEKVSAPWFSVETHCVCRR
jgi:hypothetical protein